MVSNLLMTFFSHTISALGSPFTTASDHFGCLAKHCNRSQTSIWRARPVSTQGYASIPRCRVLQSAPCSAPSVHRPSSGRVPGREQCVPQPIYYNAITVTAVIILNIPCLRYRLRERLFATPATTTLAICDKSTKSAWLIFGARFIHTHIPFHRTEQCRRGATAAL